MSLPLDFKPFPIPVVALGPGSLSGVGAGDDETLDYLTMPQGMDTYRPPVLPEPEQLAGHDAVLAVLTAALAQLRALGAADDGASAATPTPIDLGGLAPADLTLLNQLLGEGEVSAQVLAAPDRSTDVARVRIQESVFAGVWRVIATDNDGSGDGRVHDTLEVGAIPARLRAAARADVRPEPAAPAALPPGVFNAPSILVELAEHRQHWRDGQPAAVVNLTLLPVSPEDIAWIDHQLGTGRVVILSRGYGNCRITSTRVPNTWRVVYYNSQDAVILNSVEVTGLPEVACAAAEDLADSAERLAEVLQWVARA